jgi:aspartyl-tRNA(Asn)/glutamyl-tRNA(Gln) amidotransferase subunit A
MERFIMDSAVRIAAAVRNGERAAVDVLRECLALIDQRNAPLNAFIFLHEEAALAAAAEIDAKVARGEDPGPLAGVPFGVKDLEDCAGMKTTQGSVFLLDTPPKTEDSIHVARLRAAGAIPVGKTAASEFGMDGATYTRAYGVTRNPWNLGTTPGGSSGGSSAAVAAGLVPFATSTDGGGSTREPAAFTGLVGLKPSHGRIPKNGGFSNWSVHGVLTRTVAETARCLDVTAGPDDLDRQSLPAVGYRYEDVIESLEVSGLRAVFSPDHGYAVVDPEVVDIARAAARKLMAAARLVAVDELFHPTSVMRAWSAINLSNIEQDFTEKGMLPHRFDELAPKTQYLLRRLRSQTQPVDLKACWATMYQLERDVAAFFRRNDLLMTPATACPPYPADQVGVQTIDGRDATESGVEPFGMLANVCWNPSISIPAGLTRSGLPVGLQITVRRHRDDIALRLARIWEQTQPWSYPEGTN